MSPTHCAVAAFYKFVALNELAVLQQHLHTAAARLHVKGTVLLASEGINGTVAGASEAVDALLSLLRTDPRLSDLQSKRSYAYAPPFARLKVRIKREIVSLGQAGVDPTRRVGNYVEAREWNRLVEDPDVILLDTRNAYEYAVGSFAGAIDPGTRSFREFPAFVERVLGDKRDRPIATFCTGGIRCEKATSFLLAQGFKQVYHLKGGILKYLEEVAPEASLWRGECFVFDQRVAVGDGLRPGCASWCRRCGWTVAQHARCPRCDSAQVT